MNDKNYVVGELEVVRKAGVPKKLSGYLSTSTPDYEGDVIPPSSWQNLDVFRANPIVLWRHDMGSPIGKVAGRTYTDSYGLYLEDIRLSNIPLVTDYLATLINDGVISRMSAGFFAKQSHIDKSTGYRIIDACELFEASIVPVACNHTAVLEAKELAGLPCVDGLGEFETIGEIIKGLTDGRIEAPKTAYAYGIQFEETKMKTRVLKLVDVTKMGDGVTTKRPPAFHKSYTEVNDTLFLVKKEADDGIKYLYQVADPTEDGKVKYDWHKSAVAVTQAFGARGLGVDPEVRPELVPVIVDLYARLGKELPTISGIPLSDVSNEAVEAVAFKDITWNAGENDILSGYVVDQAISTLGDSVSAGATSYKDLASTMLEKAVEAKEDGIADVLKKAWGSVEVELSFFLDSYGYSAEELALLQNILELFAGSQEDGTEDSTDTPMEDAIFSIKQKIAELIATPTVEEPVVEAKEKEFAAGLTEEEYVLDALSKFFS